MPTFYLRRRGLPSFFATFDTPVTAPPGWTTVSYDPLGRATRIEYPDSTPQAVRDTLACYDDDAGVTVSLDPNRHRRRETQDVLGRTTTIEEYDVPGSPPCTTSAGSPSATTTYGYDVLNSLTMITDAAGNGTAFRRSGRGEP